jgi:ribosomal protein L29
MQVVTGQLMTHRQLRELRKRIAVIKTVIREKEISDERS